MTEQDERVVIHANSNVSRGKFAAAAVHAALTAADVHPDLPVIVLGAKPADIGMLRTVIHDAGRTEVEPGTITAGTDWAGGVSPTAPNEREAHDHTAEPKIWCETCQHTHIASIPRFTYLCKDCGWGQWYGDQAREHEFWTEENLRVAHTTYEVEHVRRSREATTEPQPITDADVEAAGRAIAAAQGVRYPGSMRDIWDRLARAALEAVEAARKGSTPNQENGSM